MQRIVIVGGGAGGLELATQLGRALGRSGKAEIVLVDANSTHLWKPLLHEVATGALDSGIDELDYRGHGKVHGFDFQLGRMCGLDREQQHVILSPIYDEDGEVVLPERNIPYHTLVLAIGSITNDFGTPGAKEHCIFLDSRRQAERFHRTLLNEFLRANSSENPKNLEIAIVGAGATGVELSAELYNTAEVLTRYGMKNVSPKQLSVTLIEAGERILPALPTRISKAATRELEALGVSVRTGTLITEATADGFVTKNDGLISAKLKVWAAGVRAPSFMATLGLETNRAHQIMVDSSLQSEDPNIFAMGDCACVLQADGKPVPPRAQAAHQQATHMFKALKARYKGQPMPEFVYKDKGSLVSLSGYSTIGSLMGNLSSGSMMIEGRLARFVYVSLYRMHQIALHGYWHTLLLSLVGHINKVIRPRLKLH
ncbi:MAG: NAD(P)/FAD-dependent oxidoreductase [Thalassolituus sp.]|jgi:NADH dehydrogenase|uniref:NADH dehydrogenase n=1 Tax=hydrothermal vent metagenome TaxID=652676 RepID=A0A160TBI9_9ZZZZ|nr:NAD(P)/FAD-dependent oxidoreductase [Thalassolituus oleivorans]AHK16712.1 NADH dehydrogenase [Thalassolituus oleivorans R6-15]MBQ0727469.1 NAD(P)/FAD-dependent oxidoreductase [Thalassolituus oleivorans]MBQ0781945.1 NAD(P)/FAD-dependent oxidoreductase [Thalassolituus oleivorans]MDF1641083.1 NAD(P)/FAD-dependent oxidoreductase [Thalassolituus oleivorans]